LSNVYNKIGRYDDAVKSWTKFLELVPNGREALTKRAWNYLYLGNYGSEIVADARSYLNTHGWKLETSNYLVILANFGYRKSGMAAEANAILLESGKKSNKTYWNYEVIRYLNAEISDEDLLKLAADNDKKTEAHAYIGMDLLLKGKRDEAKNHFNWVKDFGNKSFFEYTLAIEELKRLTK
jgi:lipoprotein NlpI